MLKYGMCFIIIMILFIMSSLGELFQRDAHIIYLAHLSSLGSFDSITSAVIELHAYCRWFRGLGTDIQWSRIQLFPDADCMYSK